MYTTARATLTVIAAALGACVLLAGCGSDDSGHGSKKAASGAPASVTASGSAEDPVIIGTPSTDPAAQRSVSIDPNADKPSTTKPTPTKTVVVKPGTCPVTAATLLADLKVESPTEYKDMASPSGLANVSCYNGYAFATTVPSAAVDPAGVLFGYNAASSRWHAVNFGSAQVCDGFVAADVAANLKGC